MKMKKCANEKCVMGRNGGGIFGVKENYCSQCGEKLVEKVELKCRHCGCRLGDSDKFCTGCGRTREAALERPAELDY